MKHISALKSSGTKMYAKGRQHPRQAGSVVWPAVPAMLQHSGWLKKPVYSIHYVVFRVLMDGSSINRVSGRSGTQKFIVQATFYKRPDESVKLL